MTNPKGDRSKGPSDQADPDQHACGAFKAGLMDVLFRAVTYLGHISVFKKTGNGGHGASPKVDACHEDHMAPHKQDKSRSCQHLKSV